MTVGAEFEYHEIGYIARSHGVHGELLMISDLDLTALLEQHPVVRYRDDRGDLVPARVQNIRLSESNKRTAFFVKLFHVDDRHTAERLKGKSIFIEERKLENVDEAGGKVLYDQFEVLDENRNPVGKVVNGFETPAQQIIEVETEDGSQIMVPAVDEYIVEVDEQNQRLICKNLDILKDL